LTHCSNKAGSRAQLSALRVSRRPGTEGGCQGSGFLRPGCPVDNEGIFRAAFDRIATVGKQP
jgi:hypothetical protein